MALDPVRHVLANGAVVIAQRNPAIPAVSMAAAVAAGGYDDADGHEGTAALVARVLDRGTETRTAAAIADDLDGRGAALSVSAGRHHVTVTATCLAEDAAPVLAVVADVLRSPVFPDGDVASRKAELITSIRQEEDDPASVAVDRLVRELYAGHPYARRVRGTVGTVESLQRADLVAFHRSRFDPATLTLVLVGSLPAEQMVALAASSLDGWRGTGTSPAAGVPDGPAVATRREVRVSMPGKAQADVAYGFVGVRRSDPGFLAAWVMNNALGQHALAAAWRQYPRASGHGLLRLQHPRRRRRPGAVHGPPGSPPPTSSGRLRPSTGDRAGRGRAQREGDCRLGPLPRRRHAPPARDQRLMASFLLTPNSTARARLRPPAAGAAPWITRDAAVAPRGALLDPARATIVVAGPEGEG